jgi:hypothetical protein
VLSFSHQTHGSVIPPGLAEVVENLSALERLRSALVQPPGI